MLKLHTKVHAGVCGRPTLKEVKCFRNVLNFMRDHKLYERSIYEGAILSERIESFPALSPTWGQGTKRERLRAMLCQMNYLI